MANPKLMMRRTLLSAMAICLLGGASVSAPALAGQEYRCKDGTAVSHVSICKKHGGYTPRANNPGNDRRACIFDRWGKHSAFAEGCLLPGGKADACLKGGGVVSDTDGQSICMKSTTPRPG